jgi:hypothetical protein
LTTSDVMPKLTKGNVTPLSGGMATLPATVTASWHRAPPRPIQLGNGCRQRRPAR